jgi:hypothetical protein
MEVIMESITLSRNELKDIVHKTVIETVTEIFVDENKVLNLIEAIEDRNLGLLIQEGRKNDFIDKDEFMKFLDSKIGSR